MSEVPGGGPPILSDDGHWSWDGQQWVPVGQVAVPVSTPEPVETSEDPREAHLTLSNDGNWRWDGGRWVPVDHSPAPTSTSASSLTTMAAPIASLRDAPPLATYYTTRPSAISAARGWILKRGLVVAAIGLALSLVLTIAVGLALISGAALLLQALLGPAFGTSAPTTSSPGIPTDQLLNGFLYVFGFFFFTSNGTPYHLSLGSSETTVSGFGALLIAGAIIVVSFSSGRALARRLPNLSLARIAACAGLLAVPYWVISVVLFLLSSANGDLGVFGKFSAGPTWLGLLLPFLIVAVPALTGAIIGHAGLSGQFARGLTRGAGFGLAAIMFGVIGTVLGAITAGIVNAIGGGGGTTPFGNSFPSAPPTTPGSTSGGSSSGGSAGVLFIAAGVVVGLIYLLNVVALLWAGNLGFELTAWSLWPLIVVVGLIGVLLGAIPLKLQSDYSEQIGFAVTFSVASFLIAAFTHIVLGSFEVGPPPATVLLVALVVGGLASIGGPILAVTPVGRMAVGLAPVGGLIRLTESVFGPSGATAVQGSTASNGSPLVWNRRFATTVVGVLVAVLILGVGGVYGSAATSPDAIATSYVNSVGLNDASAIWNDVEVSGSAGASQHLTGQADLKAMMGLNENHHQSRTGIATTREDTNGSSSTVTVSWKEGSQAASQTLVLHRDANSRYLLFPNWRIAIVPATVTFDLPTTDTKVAVDGTPVSASGSSVSVAVFPGFHRVSASASSLFDADTETVNASGNSTPVMFNLTLSSAASSAIHQSLGDFFAKCAAATVASPSGCPQSSFDSGSGFRWTVVGDPTAPLDLSIDTSNKIHAVGHYVMLDSFHSSFSTGLSHRFESGPYEAVMAWSGDSMTIESVSRAFSASQLSPPSTVTDAQIKASVLAAFKACVKAPSDGSPDCPQYDFVFEASNFHWTLAGNPTASATLTFDGDQGFWKVTGKYTFHASYDESFLGHQNDNRSGTYSAYVIYTGTKVITVYISQF
jgi:hypothetical protein